MVLALLYTMNSRIARGNFGAPQKSALREHECLRRIFYQANVLYTIPLQNARGNFLMLLAGAFSAPAGSPHPSGGRAA